MSVEAPVAPAASGSDAMEGVIEESSANVPEPETDATEKITADDTPPAPEVVATETLYIQNLNEKIKVDGKKSRSTLYCCTMWDHCLMFVSVLVVMKATLKALFKSYGTVLDVTAHRNLRMRGQAFVSFDSSEVASKALKEVNRFPLYAKPMVRPYATCSHMMLIAWFCSKSRLQKRDLMQ